MSGNASDPATAAPIGIGPAQIQTDDAATIVPQPKEVPGEHHEHAYNNEKGEHETDEGGAGKLKALGNTAPRDGDLGAQWLATYDGPRPELDDARNNELRNRIDSWMLPITCLIYFMFGFRDDANINTEQYAWLTTIIYIAQLLFQPLSVYALVRFKVNYWIIFCFFGWSSSCMILAAFKSFPGLLVFRFFLGAFEASIAPTMMILVAGWWTRREQPLRNNLWYSANGIALIMGSLVAWGFGRVDGPLATYQYIFLFNGAFGILSIIPVWLYLPSHITTAKWLTGEQKYLALERIRLNNTGTQTTVFKWSHVLECFLDIKQWMFVIMVFCVSVVSGGISAFGPIIIGGFGFTPDRTILINMVPGALGIASNLIAAFFAQRFKLKSAVIAGTLAFPLAGAAALYALPRGDEYTQQLLAVYFILQLFQALTPLVFSWTFANTAGHTKKTTTTALLFIGLCAGNMVGPQLYKESEEPRYDTGLIANLIVLIIMMGVVLLQVFYLMFLNRRNLKRRAALGKTGRHVDYSLENSNKWAAMRAANKAEGEEAGADEQLNENAFADLTDLKNEDFIYSL